ncbi:hypothetical protein D3C72_2167180 [compost metagenome]
METAEQAESLYRLGCANAQGYLYSRAIDRSAISALIKERRIIGTPLGVPDATLSIAG